MTFYSRAREGAHLISEAKGTRSREQGIAAPAFINLLAPAVMIMAAAGKFVAYDGSSPLKGLTYGYADENGLFAYDARDVEVKGDRVAWRQSAPTVLLGGAGGPVSPAGNLSVNGVVVAIADGTALAAVATAITGAVLGVSASVVDGKLRIVRASGGDIVIAGDAGVLSDLGLTAGTTFGATKAALRAADTAALEALGIIVR
ncbi:flagellin hook IN motif-containing protein [uncultured Methylobacterium sp.]|uniref:flagellin hook IN motif-containing protein n=1 Tax=uncultured Methylobacterium sp. TaxID=157278 RepID=UPI0035CBB036